jgi:5'-deoxynucleotidase YfbR-like HD superfamily hydrolase
MTVKRDDVLNNPRWAGEVLRYHTWPTRRQQSVGEHTWQVLRIWHQIFGLPSPQVCSYLLWHDAGELVLGDLPFPVKARNPTLKTIGDNVEMLALNKMGGQQVHLAPLDKVRTKACDLIEMLEFGWSEVEQGNRYGEPIVEDITKALVDLREPLPPEDHHKVWGYINAGKQRHLACIR